MTPKMTFLSRGLFFAVLALVLQAVPAFAINITESAAVADKTFSGVGDNAANAISDLPGLLAGIAYLLGILFGTLGILKLKAHVENPNQAPMKDAVIRLLAGGALFALPMVYEAMINTIGAGTATKAAVLNEVALGKVGTSVATLGVNDIGHSLIASLRNLPGLIAAISYALALLLGVLGVLKLKDHVENPAQTSLRSGMIRFIAGGALFALPIIQEAAINTIGGDGTFAIRNNTIAADILGMMGNFTGLFGFAPNINGMLITIKSSLSELPGVIAAVSYLIGVLLVPLGVLKIKDHVENPEQTPLKEGVVRLVTAGALFGLPTVYNAMFTTIGGEDGLGVIGNVTAFLGTLGFFWSSYARTICNPIGGILPGATMGDSLCTIISHTGLFPAFLTAIAYVIGLLFGVWGIFKLKSHVQNPQQTALWEGISRLFAGGAFFALPVVVEVARNTLSPLGALAVSAISPISRYHDTPPVPGDPLGLDGVMTTFMLDVMGPLHVVLNFFAFCAGIIFTMIGISRLIKSAQDGTRGPGGFGTIMTFATGAALLSYNQLITAVTTSFFTNPLSLTYATMQYTTGMNAAETDAAHNVITAIVRFVLIVGLFSFVRGIFIIRSAAEGNQQSSIMAGLTHIVAGVLAVNVGPLLNAVQESLGVTGFGIAFS